MDDLPRSRTRPMHWARWGDPDHPTALPASTAAVVDAVFGTRPRPAVDLDDVRLPGPQIQEKLLDELRTVVGEENVHTDRETRLRHTRGKSTPDLLRIRSGDATDAPDAVVLPGDHAGVQAVVEWCGQRRVALVPFGGGTSVVGGLAAARDGCVGVVALDLSRLDRLLAVDPVSGTATLQAGIRGPQAEALLAPHGMTLGHFPQSWEYATIGGFAATRSSGQASAGYGRFDAMVLGLRVVTPIGTLDLGRAPASAAGPDLRQLVLGSEGAFGVVTEVTVRVRPVPETVLDEAWRVPSFAEGVEALRLLGQDRVLPTILRLSDETETAVGLAHPGEAGAETPPEPTADGCLLITGYEGSQEYVDRTRALVTDRLTALGATPLGAGPGRAWRAGRFEGPYLRDALLDVGVLAETLETAAFWSGVPTLHAAVRRALEEQLGETAVVLCHVSHVYENGASLYFTVAAPESDDPLRQWDAAKHAATEAITAAGGTISHHHGVGRDHLPWLVSEVGPVGVGILRAVKQRLDPEGVLNPGVLVP